MQINNVLSLEPVRYKIDLMKDDIYQYLKNNIYNQPESNLIIYSKLGYSYQSHFSKKGKTISGKVIPKTNLVLELGSVNQEVVLLHGNLSTSNNLIYTNDISPYFRGKWKNIVDLTNNEDITIELTTFNGISIPLSGCYVKSSLTNNNTIYIKILNKMFIDLNIEFGVPIFLKLYHNSVFYRSSLPINKTIYSYNPLVKDYKNVSNIDHILEILTNISNEQYVNLILNINGYLYYDIEHGINKINNILSNENLLKHSYIELIIDNTIDDEFKFNSIPDLVYNNIFGNKRIIIHPNKDFLENQINTLDNIELWLVDNTSKNGIRIPYITKPIIDKHLKIDRSLNDVFTQLNKILSLDDYSEFNDFLIDYQYYNYLDISSTYNQLTHRDYSISKSYLDYVKHLINPTSNNFSLILKYRFTDKNNEFDKNGNLTEFIYNDKINDNDIISSLLNQHPLDIFNECFNSKLLEYSTYIKTLLNLPDNLNSYETINIALNSLGYLNFIEKICKSIYSIDYNDIVNNQCIIEKSIFYKNEPCSIKVFLNGKLLYNNFHYFYVDTNDQVIITFYPNIITEKDNLLIEIIPYDETDVNINLLLHSNDYIETSSPYSSIIIDYFNYVFEIVPVDITPIQLFNNLNYEPSDIYNSILIEYNSKILGLINTRLTIYDVYLKLDNKSSDKDYNLEYLPTRYKLLDPNDNDYFVIEKDYKTKSIKYKFNENSVNKTFVFYPKNYYTLHIKKTNIRYPTDELIHFPLEFNNIPILNIEDNVQVYINGKEVYQDIDYKITKIENVDGTVSGYWFTYQSLKHLKSNNTIDIYITSTKSYSILDEKSFGIDNYISCNKKLNIKDLDNYLISINGDTYSLNNLEILDGCIKVQNYHNVLMSSHLLPYHIKYITPSIINKFLHSLEDIKNNELLSTLTGANEINRFTSRILSNKNDFNEKLSIEESLQYHNHLERLITETYDKLNQDENYIQNLSNISPYTYPDKNVYTLYNLLNFNNQTNNELFVSYLLDYNRMSLFEYLKSKDNIIFSSYITKIDKLILENKINISCDLDNQCLLYIEAKHKYLKRYDLLFNNHLLYKDYYLVYASLFNYYNFDIQDYRCLLSTYNIIECNNNNIQNMKNVIKQYHKLDYFKNKNKNIILFDNECKSNLNNSTSIIINYINWYLRQPIELKSKYY